MTIYFHPQQGTILICDYSGFVAPEMIKKRPVVIISPRPRKQQHLYTVVPLSNTKPIPIESHHHKLNVLSLPNGFNQKETWANCDMITRVSAQRLDRLNIKDITGKRVYVAPVILSEDLNAIMKGVLFSLGLENLTQHL
jgi:mRNA interferase MazF